MTKSKLLIRTTYQKHFDDLREVTDEIESLANLVKTMSDSSEKKQIEKLIKSLERDLIQYAQGLKNGGIELFNHAA